METLEVAGIIPLYNKCETVIEAIESVLNQTRPVDELVVVDDGSTDGSGDLVAQHYRKDPRVRLIRQQNRGVSSARNAGIRATRSPLIAFLDADDRWLPERLEIQAAFMEEHPSCMLSFSAHIQFDEVLGESHVERERGYDHVHLRKTFFKGMKLLPACNTVMIRREVLKAVGLFDESLWLGEDNDLWLRIMVRFGFEHIPRVLAWVRRGHHRTVQAKEHAMVGLDRWYDKRRFSFGTGLGGELIWRVEYSSELRQGAHWYLRRGFGRQALRAFMRSICTWPFFNPALSVKLWLESVLGPRRYNEMVSAIRWLTGRRIRRKKVLDTFQRVV